MKTKGFIYMLLFAAGCFMYGAYVNSLVFNVKEIEPHKWIITGFFILFFGFSAADKFIKSKK